MRSQTEVQQRCSIYCTYTSQTLQCTLQIHCNQKEVYMQCDSILHHAVYLSVSAVYFVQCAYSVLTGYPSHGSVRYTACTVYTAATLYCWQWTCSIYCTPLHLYCTSVWEGRKDVNITRLQTKVACSNCTMSMISIL